MSKWSSTSLILKPDKTKGSCCLSQKSELNQETQIKFSPGFFGSFFFNERMLTSKQMSYFYTSHL